MNKLIQGRQAKEGIYNSVFYIAGVTSRNEEN